ncbi:SIMPL domain-containing protein [Mangrovibacterium lignilyticum]|uniref:SIMPL domain-containing protein n=1 Tax=Mangrovibacterium lignilyticum TaxID=2668052 RepID=UPI0013D25BFD|nr:SIMPL domain-containing protein [Mangrovibacterium lignilyticum]
MKTIYLLLALLLLSPLAKAQTPANPLESTPYVEVTGEGEMEVMPDEIYLQFSLTERYDGRNKSDLTKLESQLKKKLSSDGFDLNNLSLADANSDYVNIKRKKKDVLASKDYQMKIGTTDDLSKLWDILDELKAENATISRVDHSKMEELKKEVKIMAVKNAKEKADYLLGALDQQTGKILFLQERESYIQPYVRKAMAVSMMAEQADAASPAEQAIGFQKIKLNYKVFARFAIQ